MIKHRRIITETINIYETFLKVVARKAVFGENFSRVPPTLP